MLLLESVKARVRASRKGANEDEVQALGTSGLRANIEKQVKSKLETGEHSFVQVKLVQLNIREIRHSLKITRNS